MQHLRDRLELHVGLHGAQPCGAQHRARSRRGRPVAGDVADQQRQRAVGAFADPDEVTAQEHRVEARPVAPRKVPALVDLHSRHERLLELTQQLLGDVADRGGDQHPAVGLQRAEADLGEELAASLATSQQVKPGAHRARPRVGEKLAAVGLVALSQSPRQQHLHRPADQLLAREPEQLLGPRVDERDRRVLVDDHHCIGRGLHEPAKLLLCLAQRQLGALALGDVGVELDDRQWPAVVVAHQRLSRGHDDRDRRRCGCGRAPRPSAQRLTGRDRPLPSRWETPSEATSGLPRRGLPRRCIRTDPRPRGSSRSPCCAWVLAR